MRAENFEEASGLFEEYKDITKIKERLLDKRNNALAVVSDLHTLYAEKDIIKHNWIIRAVIGAIETREKQIKRLLEDL